MDSDHNNLSVKIQSLCQGFICHATTLDEVKQADEFAIGTLPSSSIVDIEKFYQEALPFITNQFMCYQQHAHILEQALQQRNCYPDQDIPAYFVIAEAPFAKQPEQGHAILCAQVNNTQDAILALEAGAKLIMASSGPDIIQHIQQTVHAKLQDVPVLATVSNAKDAITSLSSLIGLDGFVIPNVPSNQELNALFHAMVHRPIPKPKPGAVNIGVLAHQGDFRLQIQQLESVIMEKFIDKSISVTPVCTSEDLESVHGLLLPGGWSNLQTRLLQVDPNLIPTLTKRKDEEQMPICAVCAGMILARQNDGNACAGRLALKLIPNMTIHNNVLDGALNVIRDEQEGDDRVERHSFSNGPYAEGFTEQVKQIAWIQKGQFAGKTVGVRYGNTTAFAFHEGIHEGFIRTCLQWASNQKG